MLKKTEISFTNGNVALSLMFWLSRWNCLEHPGTQSVFRVHKLSFLGISCLCGFDWYVCFDISCPPPSSGFVGCQSPLLSLCLPLIWPSPSLEFPTLCCCSLGMSHPCTSPHNQSKPMCLRLLSCQWQGASLSGSYHLLGPTPHFMHEGWFHPPSRVKEGHDNITWLILPDICQALNYSALLCLPPFLARPRWLQKEQVTLNASPMRR